MADKPIPFSAPMVRALLAGAKTQTRRVLKPKAGGLWAGHGYPRHLDDTPCKVRPGDRLYVREAHALVGTVDPPWVIYRASGYDEECIRLKFSRPVPPEESIRWRPSIHMPRWASRITLTVTEVRVQQLQEITAADVTAEGIPFDPNALAPYEWSVARFADLWNSLHGPDAWDQNPWVVAYSFTVRQGNIDEQEKTP